jgi:hypothetical protein
MADSEEKRIEQARSACQEELAGFLHDTSPNVVRTLLRNMHLAEDDVLVITTRKNLPGDILETIAKDKRWAESYPIRLALAKNPKTPLSISLSLARYIRLFDLAEISRSRFLPVVFRHKIEAIIIEKIPSMALGVKKTLAKIVSGEVLLRLIQDGYPDVVKLCLDSPYLQESHLFKVISRHNTKPGTIKAIAEHANWSCRSMIKLALIRNEHTPLSQSVQFLAAMKIMDLRELHADPSVSVTIKPFIHRALWERGEEPDKKTEEQVYEIDEEDENMIEQFKDAPEHPGK